VKELLSSLKTGRAQGRQGASCFLSLRCSSRCVGVYDLVRTCCIGCGQAPVVARFVSLACRASPDRIDYLGLGSMLQVAIVAAHLHVSIPVAVGEIRALRSGASAGIMARLFGSQIINTEGA
jgi:hypothetical protein